MAKNLTVNNPQPVAKEKGASLSPEAQAASSNYVMSAAYDAPMAVNAARAAVQHEGAMPRSGSGQF